MVAAEVDRQLQDGVEPVQTWMPATPVYEYRDTVGEEGPGAARTREGGRLSERKARYMLREAARKVTV
jgi:hypothetical protein